MPSYMLLLYETPEGSVEMSPEEMQRIIQRYRDWGDGLRDAGKLVGSDKLRDDEGRVIKKEDGKIRVLDGPYSETKEVVGGHFTIRADDYDEAVRIAESCPHAARGGTIEIREIEELH